MLQIFEILDRFELLNNTNIKLADLRRCYNDKDLSSIFRIITDENKEDLRKLVMEDNVWSLWKLLSEYTNTQFVTAFKNFFVNNIEYDNDCFSRGQLSSKLWLVNELKKLDVELGTVFLCAGWYATLATMIFESGVQVDKIRSFDIDPSCVDIAKIFNKPWVMDNWKFQTSIEDIYNIDYNFHTYKVKRADNSICDLSDSPNTIINTSCEHLLDFKGWYSKIPNGKLIIIQANDFHDVEEHVNTYNTIEEFSASAPMITVLYEGELELQKYKRFMKIGYK